MLEQVTCNTMRPCLRNSTLVSLRMFRRKTIHKTSMKLKDLPSRIEIIIYQVKLASGIQACSS